MEMMMTASTSLALTLVPWACLLAFPSIVAAQAPVVPVNYTHNGDDLQGFKAVPDTIEPAPAVVIIP